MLEAENIHKVYNSGKRLLGVLKGIDLSVAKGRFVSVVGPSGAGKSTLLHILGGLDAPTQGKVVLSGEDIYRLSDMALCRMRNKEIGFVFQFYHLLSEFTALENVLLPLLINCDVRCALPAGKAGLRDARKIALEFLEKVGLGERTAHFPVQLSGGEQQRVAVVRALINKPHLLLCDEPTGNLDSKAGSEIIALIRKISLENQMTVVLVTHNPELAKAADTIYNLKDGILVN